MQEYGSKAHAVKQRYRDEIAPIDHKGQVNRTNRFPVSTHILTFNKAGIMSLSKLPNIIQILWFPRIFGETENGDVIIRAKLPELFQEPQTSSCRAKQNDVHAEPSIPL